MRPTTIKLGLAVIGLAVFFYGRYMEDDRVRWLAMGFLVAAFLLRFWRPKSGQASSRGPTANAENAENAENADGAESSNGPGKAG